MKHYIVEIPDDYYITEYPRTWMVQLSVKGKRITKNFSFQKFGGKSNALVQAKEFRDKFVLENKIDLNKRFKNQ
jgi:hypothetical protein